MRKLKLFLVILFTLFLPYILADELNCQYTEPKEKQELVTNLYYNDSNILAGEGLRISNTIKGNASSFDAYNHFSDEIDIKFFYSVIGYNAGSKEYRFKIEPLSSGTVKEYCLENGKNGPCEIVADTIKYEILKPTEMYSKKEVVTVNKTICKICPSGNPCKNDGERCNDSCNSKECGSEICNIAGFCGKECVVDCPEGTFKCNNKSCLKLYVKKIGEAYQCERECESSYGKDGICKRSPLEIFLWIMGAIIFAPLIYFIYRLIQKLIEYIDRINIENISESLQTARRELEKLEELKKRGDESFQELEKVMKKVRDVKKKIEKEEQELDQKYLQQLQSRFGKKNVEINEEGYPVFTDTKKRIHYKIYKDNYNEKYGKSFNQNNKIHHIDANKMNSLNFWNLIDLTEEQHDKIKHLKIIRGDWENGLKVLMKALNWTEKDLPEHIREHREDKTRKFLTK